jgi:phenylacetate-CoA ligase
MKALSPSDILRLLGQMASVPAIFARPRWSEERIRDYQLRHLKLRLRQAREEVPLQMKRGLPAPEEIRSLEDWSRLPIMTKSELLSVPPKERISSHYSIDDLIVSKSSGSTGQALDVYYDADAFFYFIWCNLRLFRMAFDYKPWHLQTYIYTSPLPLKSVFGAYPLEFVSTLTPIPETLEALRRKPPDFLVCYPSHLRAIVDQMTPEDFKRIRPLAVNVNSEMSSAAERKHLAEKLGSFVFDDYSSEELTRIASQCPQLSYHIFDDINYMEVVDAQGRPAPEGVVGDLVGTNLHNRGMPLLRYAQGDRGAIRRSKCACGRHFRVLENLEGRRNDAFVLPDGTQLSSGFLLDLTYGIFLDHDGAVRAFCLLQERADVWQLEVVPGSRWSMDLGEKIIAALTLQLRQPSVRIELKIVEQVTRTASGKANPIVSRIKKEASKP